MPRRSNGILPPLGAQTRYSAAFGGLRHVSEPQWLDQGLQLMRPAQLYHVSGNFFLLINQAFNALQHSWIPLFPAHFKYVGSSLREGVSHGLSNWA
ncbi:hypothetical protein HanIR_Chr12g0587081 [Helianthus annuus]|nr:hypothetical protein HanIR_Chr12g0587081 [Helianthus annuus]